MSFEARYHGTCSSCEEHISPGDNVTYSGDVLVHEDCPPLVPDQPVTVCPICWLTVCDHERTS